MGHRFAYSLGLALFVAGLAPGVGLANMDVSFDFGATYAAQGKGTQVGSSGTLAYYLDASQSGIGTGVTISGWQAAAENRNFRNRTNKLSFDATDGVGLDRRESGLEEGIDNVGAFDLIILQFEEMVSLERIDLGTIGSDYDLSVFAFTGDGGPVLDHGTMRYDPSHRKGMTNQGWDLIGHYAENSGPSINVNEGSYDVGRDGRLRPFSSFWAIGALTSAITDASKTFGTLDADGDLFAIRSLTVEVPEPEAFGLLGLGLLGLVILRRRPAAGV